MTPEIGIDCASCQYPTAVRLPLCSGVYMGNGLVLTAAHCVGNVGENSSAYFGESETGWELAVPIDHCVTHPDGEYDTNVWGEDSWSGVDLAYCVLAEEVAMPPIVPPMMPAGCERDWLAHEVYETGNGALATAVGTGCGIHQQYVGQDCEDGTKRFAGQQLVRQTQHLGSATKLELKRDFFGDPDDTGLRSGDSGGPLFVRLPDDTLRLVGVIHGTSGDVAYAEAVPPYLHWIEDSSGIDVTPHHAFVNGAWVTAIGSALVPQVGRHRLVGRLAVRLRRRAHEDQRELHRVAVHGDAPVPGLARGRGVLPGGAAHRAKARRVRAAAHAWHGDVAPRARERSAERGERARLERRPHRAARLP